MTQKDEALRMAIKALNTCHKNYFGNGDYEMSYEHHAVKIALEACKAALSEPETVTLPDGWIAIPIEADYNQIDAIVKELRICRARLLKTAARCLYDTVIASAPTLNEKG